MKINVILSAICIFSLSTQIQAESNIKKSPKNNQRARSVQSIEAQTVAEKTENKVQDRSVEMAVGYITGTFKQKGTDGDSDTKIKNKGIGGRLGKSFNLAPELNTTTSVLINLLSSEDDKDSSEDSSEREDVGIAEIGLSQRISYDFGQNIIIRPYLEAGVSRGSYNAEVQSGAVKGEVNLDYTKYGGALGLQFIVDERIVPFISYEVSKVKFDKKGDYKIDYAGKTESGKTIIEDEADRKFNSSVLSLGIGFLF